MQYWLQIQHKQLPSPHPALHVIDFTPFINFFQLLFHSVKFTHLVENTFVCTLQINMTSQIFST